MNWSDSTKVYSMSRVKILRASAGSGKTYRLSFEYIKAVVLEPQLYGSILAVTFTNKATSQMKRRILGELNALACGGGSYLSDLERDTGLSSSVIIANASLALRLILQDYSRFSISTIDKFFQRIVRSFLKELDLDFNYTIELEQGAALTEAVDRLVERSATDSELKSLLEQLMYGQMDQGKSWDVRPALVGLAHDLFSKEQQLDFTVDHRRVQQQFMAAKRGVQERVEQLREVCHAAMELIAMAGLEPSDFKYGRGSFAHYFSKIFNGQGVISKYNSYYAKAVADPQGWSYSSTSPCKEDIIAILPELAPLIVQVGEMYDALESDYNSVQLVDRDFFRFLLLSHLDRELKGVWRDHGRIPLHHTNTLIRKLVQGTDVPFIYEKVGTRYGSYMIDEFQDTSRGQWSNFVPLLSEAADRSERQSVMLIGDVKQAIYRWRGGDWSLLAHGAAVDLGGRGVDSAEQLRTNWRSGARIVEFNNDLIRGVVDADVRALGERFAGVDGQVGAVLEVAYDDFEQTVAPGRDPQQGYANVEGYESELDMEWMLLLRVEDMMMRGYNSSDIAVLVRRKSEGRRVAAVLLGAGYGVVSDEALLVCEAPVVELVVAVFSLSVDPSDALSLAVVNGYLGVNYGARMSDELLGLLQTVRSHSPLEGMEDVIAFFKLDAHANVHGQVGYLQALYQMLYDYCAENVADISGFLRWWAQSGVKRYMPMPEGQDAITIMTIHKAKGLEFPCVIMPFVDWSLSPSTGAFTSTTLWVNPQQGVDDGPNRSALARCFEGEEFSELMLPVMYQSKLENSCFAPDYLRETLFSHIDAVNILYVGVTRAECELYLMYKRKAVRKAKADPAFGATTVSDLIVQVLGAEPFEVGDKEVKDSSADAVHDTSADIAADDDDAASEVEGGDYIFDAFPSHDSAQGIRVRWQSQRYFQEQGRDNGGGAMNTRVGMMLHAVLEKINSLDDAHALLAQMQAVPQAEPHEIEALGLVVSQIQNNSTIASWFDTAVGTRVYSERTIMTPQGDDYRPDRVVVRGERAVVIDYKFGKMQKSSHTGQVTNYMELLRKMGYSKVEGYVWYVFESHIQHC